MKKCKKCWFFSGNNTWFAFLRSFQLICVHKKPGWEAATDANVELNRRKAQPSGKSTDYWLTNGRIQEMYGCKLTGNLCYSPTPGSCCKDISMLTLNTLQIDRYRQLSDPSTGFDRKRKIRSKPLRKAHRQRCALILVCKIGRHNEIPARHFVDYGVSDDYNITIEFL